MKRVYLLVAVSCICTILQAQWRQRPCEKLPSHAVLANRLKNEPAHKLNPRDFSVRCNVTDSIRQLLLMNLKTKPGKGSKIESIDKTVIVRTVAFLNMTAAMPLLQKAYADTTGVYNRHELELALARLGDRVHEANVINKSIVNNRLQDDDWLKAASATARELIFVNSQESIFHAANLLDSTKQYMYLSSGGIGLSAYQILGLLGEAVLNPDFQQMLKGVDFSGGGETGATLEKCKQWLIRNKGKYKLNKEVYSL